MKQGVRVLLSLVTLITSSTAVAANSGVTYQGRILRPDGSPLAGQFTQFKLQLRTPDSQDCLMYEEVQSQDLRNSNGAFSLTINDGNGSRIDTTGLTLDRIFANRGTFTLDPTKCSSGAGTYLPNASDGRNLVVLFKDETMSTWEPIPAQKINFVPFAFESKQVAGFTADSLLRVVNGSGDPLTGLAPLSNAQYTELMALVNGTSNAFTKAGQLGGVALPTMTSGEVLGWNGSAWVSQPSVAGPNSVTTAMIQNSAVDSTKIATGAVGTSQVASNVTINTSGTVGAAITTTRDFKIFAASPSTFNIDMQAPALAASYSLVWPMDDGNAGEVLTTDGSGIMSWAPAAPASQWTTHTPNISYDGGGNVGIGTTAPGSLLDLRSDTSASQEIRTYGAAANSSLTLSRALGTQTSPLSISNTNTVGEITGAGYDGATYNALGKIRIAADGAVDSGKMYFQTRPSGGSLQTRMSILSNGYVGIGTTSPQAGLHVAAGTVGLSPLRISRSNNSTQDAAVALYPSSPSGANPSWQFGLTANRPGFVIQSYDGATQTDRVYVTASGNVGIGTTVPTAKLMLAAGSASTGTAPLKFSSGVLTTTPEDGAVEYDGTGLWFTIGSTRYVIPTNTAAGNYSNVSTISNAAGSITMTPMAGNSVIVNQTTTSMDPTSGALIVNGGAGVAGAINAGGNITSGGSITAATNAVIPQLYGSTAANGNIRIDGTSNATPGNVYLASAGGFVGIGTTSPSQKLEVAGNIAVQNSGQFWINGVGHLAQNSDAGLALVNFNATPITFRSNTVERMRIDATGNVGIGTTSPTEKLQIAGAVRIANSVGNAAGTLRWNGTNFQGSDGVSWFNIMPNPPAAGGCDQTQVFNTPGTYGYTVPSGFATLTVKVWGGGGAGGQYFSSTQAAGSASTISSLGLSAGGGGGGSNRVNNAPGIFYGLGGSSGGGSLNIPGNDGAHGTQASVTGSGGSAPGGGAGGVGVGNYGRGNAGATPGGGGGAGGWENLSTPAGGGSGGYTEKTFTSLALPPGTTINDIVVGAGGVGGDSWHSHGGGSGGNGQVSITCSTTGAPPVNNRSVIFQDAGAYSSSTNLVYDASGNLGVGTPTPQATLDINGTARLKKQTGAPTTCTAARDGTIALTSGHTLCICDGSAWVKSTDGVTACVW